MAKLVVRKLGIDVTSLELGYGEEYLVGRSAECAVILEESKAISRQHLKISMDAGIWTAELLSKYGILVHEGRKLERIELRHETTFSIPPYEFLFLDSPEKIEKPNFESRPAPSENSLIISQATTVSPFNPMRSGGLKTEHDETDSGQPALIPVLKISFADRSKDEVVRLEGNIWVAGRDLSCEISIDDHHVSRQHFELSRTEDGFTLADLGSANGTVVNGQRLKPHEPITLQSGDRIAIMDVNIEFELRDPQFEKRLALATRSLPAMTAFSESEAPHFDFQPSHISSSLSDQHGPAVIRVQRKDKKTKFDKLVLKDPQFYRQHKIKIVIAVLLGLVLYGLASEEPKKVDKVDVASTAVNFDQLTPEKKAAVKDSFQLATNLYVQGKYELCISELKKLHGILPHYDNSKELQNFCEQGSILVAKKRDMERLEEEKENIERQIQIVAEDCKAKVNSGTTSEEIQKCLGPAIELDPEHHRIIEVLQAVESIEMQRRDVASQQAQYQQRVRAGKSHFNRAQNLKQRGRLAAALEEYKKFLAAGYPSVAKEEEIANREISSVKKEIDVKVSTFLNKCKSEKGENKFKQAFLSCEQAEKEDPGNAEAKKEMRSIESELKRNMKAIYEDSILEESLGNVDAAKEKWKKIVEDDLKGAEYHEKARRKLQKYGQEM